MWGPERDAPVVVDGGGRLSWGGNNWLDSFGIGGSHGGGSGGYSNESEHDLAAMVADFLELGTVQLSDSLSYSSSDSDSCFSHLAEQISFLKHSDNQFESDLTLVVHSLILSIAETSHPKNPDTCNAGCIRVSLAKLLQSSGYDAAICTTKWPVFGKVPGGEHEFIDVINHQSSTSPERYIIDIDFRSNFEIARAVKPYDLVLNSLPSVYVGTLSKLKQYLKIMVEATTYSLKQNSMPLPPWRSLAYMEAKWETPCQKMFVLHGEKSGSSTYPTDHLHCVDLLTRMKSSVGSEISEKTSMVHAKSDRKRHHKIVRKLHSLEWM